MKKIKLTESPNGQSVDFFLASVPLRQNFPHSSTTQKSPKLWTAARRRQRGPTRWWGPAVKCTGCTGQIRNRDQSICNQARVVWNRFRHFGATCFIFFHLLSLSTIDCNWVFPQFPRQCPTSRLRSEKNKGKLSISPLFGSKTNLSESFKHWILDGEFSPCTPLKKPRPGPWQTCWARNLGSTACGITLLDPKLQTACLR